MADTILSCPFCKSHDTDTFESTKRGSAGSWWVSCQKCQACGPAKKLKPEAIAAWNRVK